MRWDKLDYSKQGWDWSAKTLPFFLPAESAVKLTRVGPYYVNYHARSEYLYELVYPSMRSVLHQPGLKIPPDLIRSYFIALDKEESIQKMETSAVTSGLMKSFDPSAVQ